MKKLLFFTGFFLIGFVSRIYSMVPDPGLLELKKGKEHLESTPKERLFIENRATAAVITYQYDSKEEEESRLLQRVVYSREIIWIDNPRNLISLKINPHGKVKGWLDPEVITFGKVPTEDFAAQIKKKISPEGGIMLTIEPGYAFYNVDVKPHKAINIASVISLKGCIWLGDIFIRAGIAFDSEESKKEEIIPEYILGVLPRPTKSLFYFGSDPKKEKDYKESLEVARNNLLAGWDEAMYEPVTGLLDKEAIMQIIGSAYTAMRRPNQENIQAFKSIAYKVFDTSSKLFKEHACKRDKS